MLHNMLNRFPAGRRLQVLSEKQQMRLQGAPLAEADLSVANKYKMLRALHVVKRLNKPVGALNWNDTLFLAANEHANDICANGAVGSIGSDGKTLPSDRAAKWGQVGGLEDYVVMSGANPTHPILGLIVDG